MKMDPDINLEWLDKHEPEEEEQQVGNICRSWQWRERGLNPPKEPSNKRVLENVAEDILVQKPLNIKCCDLPGHPRSTFLMVFSPDGTKVASTHGNHNVYVSELSSGKHVRILQGHPRTPWCIAFHPSHPQLIGSGCLGGQVRVWDLSGGSETWTVANKTVIASIAFHPRDQLLVIATFNELYFWDWSLRAPFTRVCTHSVSEKVRYVAFDSLGYKLITGISVWSRGNTSYSLLQNINQGPSAAPPRAEDNNAPNQGNNQPDSPPENIVTSYQNLVQRYDNLVRNYERLFLARHPLLNLDVANANTTDRGTDPMETDALTRNAYYPWSLHSAALYRARQLADAGAALSNQNESDNADGENSNGRLFNFDVLSLGSNPPRPLESDHDYYGPQNDPELSRTPASQRYNGPHPTLRPTLRTRLLPNPFSSNNLSRSDTVTFSNNNNQPEAGTSRTSVFTSHRQDSPSARFFMHRRQTSGTRHLHFGSPTVERAPAPTPANAPSPPPAPTPAPSAPRPAATPPATASPSASTSSASRPPPADPTTAYTIRECLELFREILRDSGHRLSNIISNMSLATIADIDRSLPRRHAATSDDSDGPNRTNRRPRLRIYNAAFRRELLSTDTESEDSDRSVEVNLRDTTFRRGSNNADPRTSRFHINLSDTHIDQSSPIAAEFFSGRRFRIRRHSTDDNVSRQQSTSADGNTAEPGRTRTEPPDSDPNRPSTSRDTRNTNDPLGISANESSTLTTEEAFAKVRLGVAALRKHTVHLTDLWLRGVPTTMRELRTMWENLRRRTLSLQRQTGTQDVPSYFSRDLMERCRMLTHTTRRGVRRPRDRRANNSSTNDDAQQQASTSSTSSSVPTETEAPRPRLRRSFLPPLRRRPTVAPRSARSARISRSYDVYCTRNEIRMRAMQVLTAMFNMMMNCLEQRGLSHIIIHMLRMLKKALALTCLMLVAAGRQHRQNPEGNLRSRRNAASNASNDETQDDMFDFLSDQNLRRPSERVADHARRSNTRHDDDESSVSSSESDEKHTEKSQSDAERKDTSPEPSTSRQAIGRWSNRLAVQIAAANRNNSNTARSRRDLYLETKRQKALHKTNPSAHPISKKRVMPPSVTSRIPSIRRTPARQPNERSSPKPLQRATEPVAGPSSRPDAPTDPYNRYDADFENRVNLLRIAAHMHAVRMRTAASRTRFRRLQAIRLYTPYSVREMFTLQSNNQANQGIVSDRPSPMSPDRPSTNASPNQAPTLNENMFEGPGQLDFVLNNAPVPPGDEANNSQRQNAQPQRPTPPPQDYLQPIILAQNALVVDEGGGGGGDAPTFGSFLDAGFSSESIPSYTHRVQAWDFTKGETPDIADSLKNIVVPRCRIHNDASIDISKDGRFLVAFLPVPRLRNANHWLGVYSLEWPRLGQCLHTAMLEQSAVSVALSPTARYLAVGVGSRRFTTLPSARTNVFALLYKLQPSEDSERTALAPIKELEQNWQQGLTSLNCLRWAPQPGQGLVYANNTGQLIIMS